MESEGLYYSGCDHWPSSRSLYEVGPILSLVFQRKSKNDAFSGTLSIKASRSRDIFFYQNAALIDGLRFMSRGSDMITHTTWPSIHISFYLTIHPSPPSLSLSLSSTLSLSLHHPPSVLYPMRHISLPPAHHLHQPHFFLFSSLSTICSPLLPCPARNCWN